MTSYAPSFSSSAPVDAKDLANFILDWADEQKIGVSNLALQKLVFFCHGSHLTRYGAPLVRNKFEAWKFGPVIPSLYRAFQVFKSAPISSRAFHYDRLDHRIFVEPFCPTDEVRHLLSGILTDCAALSAYQLSELSHRHGGPWSNALEQFGARANFGRVIDNDLIRRTFSAVNIC